MIRNIAKLGCIALVLGAAVAVHADPSPSAAPSPAAASGPYTTETLHEDLKKLGYQTEKVDDEVHVTITRDGAGVTNVLLIVSEGIIVMCPLATLAKPEAAPAAAFRAILEENYKTAPAIFGIDSHGRLMLYRLLSNHHRPTARWRELLEDQDDVIRKTYDVWYSKDIQAVEKSSAPASPSPAK